MSFTAGVLALAVWLCLNEVSVNGFLLHQIWRSEARHGNMLTQTSRITLMSSDWRLPVTDMQIEILSLGVITSKVL